MKISAKQYFESISANNLLTKFLAENLGENYANADYLISKSDLFSVFKNLENYDARSVAEYKSEAFGLKDDDFKNELEKQLKNVDESTVMFCRFAKLCGHDNWSCGFNTAS